MNDLINKLIYLQKMEDIANHAMSDWESDPESKELERTFDRAYQNEYNAFIDLVNSIVQMSNNQITFYAAKKLLMTKKDELLALI